MSDVVASGAGGVDLAWQGPVMIAALIAFALASTAAPAPLDNGDFERCIEEAAHSEDFRPCYAAERTRLQAEQDGLIARLFDAFVRAGPPSTSHAAAVAALRRSQALWAAYLDTDCSAFAHAFGNETAFGFPRQNCLVDHYRTRNSVLRDLMRSVSLPTNAGSAR